MKENCSKKSPTSKKIKIRNYATSNVHDSAENKNKKKSFRRMMKLSFFSTFRVS